MNLCVVINTALHIHNFVFLFMPTPSFFINGLTNTPELNYTDGWDKAKQSYTVSVAMKVFCTGWAYGTMCLGFTNNKPVLCIFVSVLMSGKKAVALHALFRPLANPLRASSVCPACPNCSSSRGILDIVASLNNLFQCFWKELLRRHHAAAFRESYQEPGHRG